MADQRSRRRRIAGESRPGQTDSTGAATETDSVVEVQDTAPAPEARSTSRPKVARPARPRRAAKVEETAGVSLSKVGANDDDDATDDEEGADVVSPSPDAPVAPDEDTAADRPAPAAGPSPWSRPLVALAAVALVAAVFGVYGVFSGVSTWLGARGVDSSQSQAAEQAATDVEQIFSYDYDKLDEHLSDAKELMTPAFAKQFDSIAPALTDLAPQRKIQVKASSREAAPVPCGDDCSDDSAQVTVFFDQARLADGSTQPTVFGNRVLVSMTKDGGTWKVSDIKAL